MNNIRLARIEDQDMILSLYHSLIGTPGCTWTMEYPTIEEIEQDIENKSLYCMCEDDDIVAVATAGYEDGYEHLNWDPKVQKPCFLSRVGVKQSMHNHGLGRDIVKHVIQDIKRRGFDGIRLLVSKTNHSAMTLYEKLGFHHCGEARMYDNDWYCYQMILEDTMINV